MPSRFRRSKGRSNKAFSLIWENTSQKEMIHDDDDQSEAREEIMRIKLTEKAIARIKAPDPSGKQILHWDTELKGFAVLASGVTNARTFIVQRDLPSGITRRMTVGKLNEITLEEARSRAADMLDQLRRGIDPKAGTSTLRTTLESYLAARKNLRPATIRLYRKSVEDYLTPWLDLQLADITGEMIEDRHRSIVREVDKGERYKGTSIANFSMRTFRTLYNFAAERTPNMPPNPTTRLRRQYYPERKRTRMISSEQLPQFYQAVKGLPNPIVRDYLLLLLFTGMRLSESISLRWDDVDLKQKILRLPATVTKAGRALVLPMSDFVHDLLVARRSIGNAGFVFPGKKGAHISNPQHIFREIGGEIGMQLSAHDLRRTFITIAESTDISPYALKALVNHSVGADVTAGYIQISVERLREPNQRIADQIKELCGIVEPFGRNVKRLRKE
jgi:integrase